MTKFVFYAFVILRLYVVSQSQYVRDGNGWVPNKEEQCKIYASPPGGNQLTFFFLGQAG